MLRHSPRLTLASLVARRANALKSTGPRTDRGKAWSCLNALRHGCRSRRRTFRDKLVRTGDSEGLYLFDFIFEELLRDHEGPSEFVWRRLESLAVRAWCIESGRRGRKVAKTSKTSLRTKLESGVRIARYAENFMVPRRLKITNKAGWGFMLVNPVPSRRRRVASSWIPEVEYLEGKLPKARRVRGTCQPETQMIRREPQIAAGGPQDGKRSRWGAVWNAIGRLGSSIGSSIFGRDVGTPRGRPGGGTISNRAAAAGRPQVISSPLQEGWDAVEGDWEDGDESQSPREVLLLQKFIAKVAQAAERSRKGGV